MVKVQLEIPDELDKQISIDKIKQDMNDKRDVIIKILQQHYDKNDK